MPFAKNSVEKAQIAGMTADDAFKWSMRTIHHILQQTPAEDATRTEKMALAYMQEECRFLYENQNAVSAFAMRNHLKWLTDPVVRKVSKMAGSIKIPVKALAEAGVQVRFFKAECHPDFAGIPAKPTPAVASIPLSDFVSEDSGNWASLDKIISDAVKAGEVDLESGDLVPLLIRRQG